MNLRAGGGRTRVLYVVSEDWYFLSHRLPMARAARQAGFEVHVATNVTDGAAAIAAEGFVLHPVPFARGRLSPGAMVRTIVALRRVQRAVRPAITHHVSLQPAVLGLLAALGTPTACVNALTGLGYAFTSETARARAVLVFVKPALRWLLDREGMTTLVQNQDDFAALTALGIAPRRIAVIPGSGVDTARFQPLPEPPEPPTVAFVGRLLEDKGIRTVVAAHRLLRAQGINLQLLIAGMPDPANAASVSEAEAAGWNQEPGIIWRGNVEDIRAVWARAHIAVLPSRREGLPLSLLEAAACGRPMIATDVPGCRSIVVDGKTGVLVPPNDAEALGSAIARLGGAPDLRARYGAAARRLVVERFAADIIGAMTVGLYRQLIANNAADTQLA